MSKPILNVFKFLTESGNQYIFDNVSGVVIPCTNEHYAVIENYYQFDKSHIIKELETKLDLNPTESSAYYTFIENLIQNGFFYKSNEIISNQVINDYVLTQSSSSMLVLVVTEECNLRCKYCVYSGHYPLVKTYSDKKMTFDVAKEAIDYYFDLHAERQRAGFKKRPMIGFYGGEPLLEFHLIKQIMEYCNTKDLKPTYYITTNGTLLNRDTIDFIVNEDVVLTVSLDGDKYQHDRNRVFQSGQGTFDQIMKNLIKLQTEKRKRNINLVTNINCCYDSLTDICKVVDFFKEQRELLEPFYLMFNEVSKFDTTYYDHLNEVHANGCQEAQGDNFVSSFKKLMELTRNDLLNGRKPADYLASIFTGLLFCKNRVKGTPVVNTCMPGSKLTVDPDGYFYVCERINQQFPIGDVYNKINYDKANSLIESFNNILQEHCSTCNLSRLCDVCYVHFIKEGRLEFDPAICQAKQKSIRQLLRSIYSMLELNPKAFDSLEELSGFETNEILIK